jgi:segregation and condensation protein B
MKEGTIAVTSEQSLNLQCALEGVLVATRRYISLENLVDGLGQPGEVVLSALNELEAALSSHERGLYLAKSPAGYRIRVKPHLGDLLVTFMPERAAKPLSEASREVLAIIIWNQHVTLAEITKARGTNSEFPLQTLVKRKFVAPVKPIRGRARTWRTTQFFLDYFDLDSLDDLREEGTRHRVFGDALLSPVLADNVKSSLEALPVNEVPAVPEME